MQIVTNPVPRVHAPCTTLLISTILIITIALTFTACNDKCENPVYHKFTDDDMKWVQWQGDTLQYLVNGIDTVSVHVTTSFTNIESEECEDYEKAHAGVSFNELIDFINNPHIYINKREGELSVYIYISLPNGGIGRTNINVATIDTGTINTVFYDSLYKYNHISDDTNALNEVYFAKGYGYVKIKLNNKNKIELINN